MQIAIQKYKYKNTQIIIHNYNYTNTNKNFVFIRKASHNRAASLLLSTHRQLSHWSECDDDGGDDDSDEVRM